MCMNFMKIERQLFGSLAGLVERASIYWGCHTSRYSHRTLVDALLRLAANGKLEQVKATVLLIKRDNLPRK